MASAAPFVAVIDADLQHDETLLPAMLAKLKETGADLAVGGRYLEAGGMEQGSCRRCANWAAGPPRRWRGWR